MQYDMHLQNNSEDEALRRSPTTDVDAVKKPAYGRRIFVNTIDQLAATEPSRTWLYVPRSAKPQDGWKPVTFGEYANAINRTAHWLVKELSQGKDFPTIAYIGPNDVRYTVLLAASVKAGFQLLLPSPRNNPESQVSLFNVTDCQCLIYTDNFAERAQPWLEKRRMATLVIDSIDSLFDPTPVPHFPYSKTYEDAKWDPAVILHTSGSTGTPKPIIVRHGLLAIGDEYQSHPKWEGTEFFIDAFAARSKMLLSPMPLFHALGLYIFISLTIDRTTPMMLGIPELPVTADNLLQFMEYSGCDGVLAPPSVLIEMVSMPQAMEAFKRLSLLMTGGGAISKEAGDSLVKAGVPFCNGISTTEYGFYPIYWQNRPELWDYFVYNNDLFNCEYREIEPGLYEQIIKRKAEDPGLQGLFYSFPNIDEYHTGDLYEQHPKYPNLWKHCGRTDDVIVFSNGEKLNPVTIEHTVSKHPDVKQAFVVGAGKFQAGMIIEPNEGKSDGLIDRVWPIIEAANAETVAHGRISKYLVRLSDPAKPFLYSAKGSLRKGAVKKLYKDEIDALYTQDNQESNIDISSVEALRESLRELFKSMGAVVEDDVDFAAVGVDSLQVINAAKFITTSLHQAGSNVTMQPRDIYNNFTLNQLSQYVFGRISNTEVAVDDSENQQRLLRKYAKNLPKASNKPAASRSDQTVIVTGTTGSLGSYLLHFLEQAPQVSRIICLNRDADGGKTRQAEGNKHRNLITSFEKAEFHQADLTKSDFGISNYSELLKSADVFIHNAWPVNFNLALISFERQILGVRNIIDFVSECDKQVSVSFMSSVGTADQWQEKQPVPEVHQTDFGLATLGYGQSKLLGSILLHDAGIPASIIRVGQIAGSRQESGEWNKQEWLPTIIASSVKLGVLPESLGASDDVDWMPIEDVALSILDISGCTSNAVGDGYFNLVNPKHTSWRDLAPAVHEYYSKKGRGLKQVSFAEWLKAVESGPETPAIKLLDTYKGLLKASEAGHVYAGFATERSEEASKTVREMSPVTPDLIQLWCKQWNF